MRVAAPARRPPAPPFVDPPGYARHRPETTLLYQLVARHFPAFRELREGAGRPLPGVGVAPGERAKRERMCRYASRPPVAAERLALTPSGLVRYALKTPYRDGTTHAEAALNPMWV